MKPTHYISKGLGSGNTWLKLMKQSVTTEDFEIEPVYKMANMYDVTDNSKEISHYNIIHYDRVKNRYFQKKVPKQLESYFVSLATMYDKDLS